MLLADDSRCADGADGFWDLLFDDGSGLGVQIVCYGRTAAFTYPHSRQCFGCVQQHPICEQDWRNMRMPGVQEHEEENDN